MLGLSFLLIACTETKGPLNLGSGADERAVEANALGRAHYNLGDEEYGHWYAAKDYFEDAVKIDPALAEAHYNLALTLDQLGEHGEATAHFKKAAELAPGNRAITGSEAYRRHVGQSQQS
jgi:tetratricopeptide (TPR) repeat protein